MKRGILIYEVSTGKRFKTVTNETNGKIMVKGKDKKYRVASVEKFKRV